MTLVGDVTPFPVERGLEFSRQGDRREFVFMACEGQPPARRKKLVLEARAIGLIDDGDAALCVDALDLRAE